MSSTRVTKGFLLAAAKASTQSLIAPFPNGSMGELAPEDAEKLFASLPLEGVIYLPSPRSNTILKAPMDKYQSAGTLPAAANAADDSVARKSPAVEVPPLEELINKTSIEQADKPHDSVNFPVTDQVAAPLPRYK